MHAGTRSGRALVAGSLFMLLAASAQAVQTSYWRAGWPLDFLEAETTDVAVGADGSARLAPGRQRLADPGQAYIWCLAQAPDGTIYAGTGDDGQVLAIPPGGEPRVYHDSVELQILALAIGPDGAVYAGGSPDGNILRIKDGHATTYFDTPETYIWSLVFGADGALYAATGNRARIYRITGAGEGDVYYHSREVHLLSMVRDGDGLVVGTSPGGLVLRVVAPDSARVLYDAPETEIKSLVRDGGGNLYIAAVGEKETGGNAGKNGGRADAWTIIDADGREEAARGDGAAVYRLAPDGAVVRLWKASEEMVLGLAVADDPAGDGVWVGTGAKGALYRLDGRGTATRMFETEEAQVVALLASGGGLVVGTTNPGRVYRVGPDVEREGFLTSEVYDARNVAAWGRARWQARSPAGTAVRLQTRSGNTEQPGAEWSGWSSQLRDPLGAQIPSPPARFLQWRARLVGSGRESPVLETVTVAYLERNLPPRVHGIDVVASAGDFLPTDDLGAPDRVQQTLPTGVQVEFAFPHSEPRAVRLDQVGWMRTMRVASWVADDPNRDELRFNLYLKGEDESRWQPLAEDLEEQIFAFQTADLEDGRYRVKVVASDRVANPAGLALADSLVGRSFVVDNTPPQLEGVRAQRRPDGRLLVTGEASDSESIIASLEYTLDGDDWRPVFPEDSIFDAPAESFRFEIELEHPEREHRVLVRAADELGNAAVGKALVP